MASAVTSHFSSAVPHVVTHLGSCVAAGVSVGFAAAGAVAVAVAAAVAEGAAVADGTAVGNGVVDVPPVDFPFTVILQESVFFVFPALYFTVIVVVPAFTPLIVAAFFDGFVTLAIFFDFELHVTFAFLELFFNFRRTDLPTCIVALLLFSLGNLAASLFVGASNESTSMMLSKRQPVFFADLIIPFLLDENIIIMVFLRTYNFSTNRGDIQGKFSYVLICLKKCLRHFFSVG